MSLFIYVLLLQIEKEAQTWLDSDDEEEGEKKPEETKTEEAPPSAESSEPQPGTSKDSEEAMERSPMEYMRAEESELEELQGAVGGSDWCCHHSYIVTFTVVIRIHRWFVLYVPGIKLVWW